MTAPTALDDPNFVLPRLVEEEPAPPKQVDYFGFGDTGEFTFPDGVSKLYLVALNEGAKKQFQKTTQSDLILERGSGNARLKVDQGQVRHELIKTAVTGWNLVRNGVPIPFGDRPLKDFLTLADPKLIENIELAIREMNPWLMDDQSVEEIDKEIESLKERRELALKREAEKASSSSK